MTIKITTIDEAIEDNGIKVLVHGLSGAGKTVMCATAGAPTLILNAECGLLSLKGAPSYIQTAEVKTMADFEEIIKMLDDERIAGHRRFDWLALDSISDVAEAVLKVELDACADPRKSYPAFQSKIDGLIKQFRDLRDYNVIMTAKQMMTKDDYTGITLRSPMMPGNKLGPAVPYLFDLVLALRVDKDEDGVDYRVVQTGRDIMYEAKDRSGMLNMFEPPSLKKIYKKIHASDPIEAEASEVLGSDVDSLVDAVVEPIADLLGKEIEAKTIYWEHSSGSVGECLASEFEALCDEADGEIEEISQEKYDSKMASKQKE